MLYKIILDNFMAYGHQEVILAGAKTIAVVGENGSGKSAFLEAVPYAYYGIGRGTLSELSRLTGDGTHQVTLEHRDIPNLGDTFIIERGQNKSGKGFVKVYLNDELIGKGSTASYKIIEIIGMSQELFMLTAFFGLGDDKKSDTLIKVGPADRLETLQKLANVEIYKAFYKKTDIEYKSVLTKQGNLESAIEVLESVSESTVDMQTTIIKSEKAIVKYSVDLVDLRVRKEALLKTEEQYKLAVQRRDKLEYDQINIDAEISDCQSDLVLERSTLEDTEIELKRLRELLDSYKAQLKGYDITNLEKERDKIANAGTSKKTLKGLRDIVVGSDQVDKCPLCGSAVSKTIVQKWKDEIVVLTSEIADLKLKYTANSDERKTFSILAKTLQTCKADIEKEHMTHTNAMTGIEKLERAYEILKSKKTKIDADYVKVSRTIGKDAMSVAESIRVVSDEIEAIQKSTGEAEATIKHTKMQMKKAKADAKELRDLKKQLISLQDNEKAYAVLKKAFHRYGIPLELLRDMNKQLGEFATVVYQEFDNGIIAVVETEGARPGLEFTLSDRKGVRRWGLLSLGEKVMFFISIRVALTKIIAKAVNAKINFVILDEIMGNLSPKKQTDMVRVASKILRQVFPQVIIVSHTSMNDIFDRSLLVKQENELSKIEVV